MTTPAVDLSAFSSTDDALVLAFVSSLVEMQLLKDWLDSHRAAYPETKIEVLQLPRRDSAPAVMAQLVEQLQRGEQRSVVPLRVFWLPQAEASAVSRVVALLPGHDPYHPNERQQGRIVRREPARARVVAGEPATVAELREQWSEQTIGENPREFANFVTRRARLALERTEYRMLGPQYKSPRLVKPEILASARFRDGLTKIPGATLDEAGRMLDELATGWSRVSIDVIGVLGRMLSRGFDPEIDYDEYQVAAMRTALQAHPAVLLFSHRSYIDGAVVPVAMQENRLPPVHVFAGINLSFGLMGPLLRRSGVIFIRRKIDNPLYRYVLKEYIGYVVQKRFNLSWSIEGTRSRTGKMLPPKLGLMTYVADAYLDGRTDDILLQGISISFDQLHETAEYAAYARGGEKTPEGLSWLYRFIKAQGERNYGKIYVRFPEAVSMGEYLGASHGSAAADHDDAKRLAMQKMAFEVAWRIQRVTPISATALVSALLLATRGQALTLGQLHRALQDSLDYLERKHTPMTTSALRLRTPGGVRAAADALSGGHPVTRVDGGREPVWRIAPDDEHAAAFYRNSVIHAFLETSIVGLALAHARNSEGDRLAAFWKQVMRLRDLLKFEFYFAGSAEFRENIEEEVAWHSDWESRVTAGGAEVDTMLYDKRPIMADAMLRVFFEAYGIVADVLLDAPAQIDERELTQSALGVGRQYVAQGRVRSSESASALLFATARQVVADQHLVEETPDLAERRTAFRRELRGILKDLDHVALIARQQFGDREAEARKRRPRR